MKYFACLCVRLFSSSSYLCSICCIIITFVYYLLSVKWNFVLTYTLRNSGAAKTWPTGSSTTVLRVPIQVSQGNFMLKHFCVRVFLGYDLPIQLGLKLLSSEYEDRLEECFITCILIHLINYETCNNLCLTEQIDLHVSLPVIYHYSCFFV